MTDKPTALTDAIVERICRELAEGKTLREIAAADDMPAQALVYQWLAEEDERYEAFRLRYARAREAQALRWVEEIMEIADDGTNDYVARKGRAGTAAALDSEHVQRSRLRVETRKWLLSKLQSKDYGEKIELSGDLLGIATGISRDRSDIERD